MRAAALSDAEPSRVGLILLAAGGSRRLGTPKQLLGDIVQHQNRRTRKARQHRLVAVHQKLRRDPLLRWELLRWERVQAALTRQKLDKSPNTLNRREWLLAGRTTVRQQKAGFNRSGTQRRQCQHCRRYYTDQPKKKGYSQDTRRLALKMVVDGTRFRRTARLVDVCPQTVITWVNAAA